MLAPGTVGDDAKAKELQEFAKASEGGQFLTTELSFYTCLTLAALYPDATADEQQAYARTRIEELEV